MSIVIVHFSLLRARGRCEGDDFVTPQRLEEGLEAAADKAADELTVDLDLADAHGLLDLLCRWRADEGDLDALGGWAVEHGTTLGLTPRTPHRPNC